ncbi:MAG: hypothetical protein ABR985_05885 [Methanotrichaceae archaeon]
MFDKSYTATSTSEPGGAPTVIYMADVVQYQGGFEVDLSDGQNRIP